MKNKYNYSKYKCPYSHLENGVGHELKGSECILDTYGVWCRCGFRGPTSYLSPKDLNLELKEDSNNRELTPVLISELIANWDTSIIDLYRNEGMFVSYDVRARDCSLQYNNISEEYYVMYKDVTFGIHDIYNLRESSNIKNSECDIKDIAKRYSLIQMHSYFTGEAFEAWIRPDETLMIQRCVLEKGKVVYKFRILPNIIDEDRIGHIDFTKHYYENFEDAAKALVNLNVE